MSVPHLFSVCPTAAREKDNIRNMSFPLDLRHIYPLNINIECNLGPRAFAVRQ